MSRPRVLLAAAASAVLPSLAHACAVCGADGGPSRSAFFWSTIALSLIPLALFAGGLWFLRRSAGQWMRDDLVERPDPVATGSSEGSSAAPGRAILVPGPARSR